MKKLFNVKINLMIFRKKNKDIKETPKSPFVSNDDNPASNLFVNGVYVGDQKNTNQKPEYTAATPENLKKENTKDDNQSKSIFVRIPSLLILTGVILAVTALMLILNLRNRDNLYQFDRIANSNSMIVSLTDPNTKNDQDVLERIRQLENVEQADFMFKASQSNMTFEGKKIASGAFESSLPYTLKNDGNDSIIVGRLPSDYWEISINKSLAEELDQDNWQSVVGKVVTIETTSPNFTFNATIVGIGEDSNSNMNLISKTTVETIFVQNNQELISSSIAVKVNSTENVDAVKEDINNLQGDK